MNRQVTSGVDEVRLDKLIQKILSNLEQLERRFNQLDATIDRTKNFYKSDSASKYRKSYNDLRYNYGLVKKNILSYVNDLTRVKSKYKNFETLATDLFKGTGG